jgi:hypothetical protein
MLRDIFRRVAPFGLPEDYVYAGFGSVWFADFILFHRALGVKEMVSIEGSKGAQQRIVDNAPFRINLDFARSGPALKRLDWSKHHFLWLDYDDPISREMLRDVRYVAEKASSGSILAVSVRSEAATEFAQADGDTALESLSAIERFRETFTTTQIPSGTNEEDLTGRPFASLSRTMIATEIGEGLDIRNRKEADPIRFKRICNFDYADGAEMTTIIGIFHSETDESRVSECHFEELSFINELGATISIDVPLLTVREVRKLEAQLPLTAGATLALGSMPEREAERFARLYRYLPHYAVLES